MSTSIPEQIVALLRKRPTHPLCDECIATELGLANRQEAQQVTASLAHAVEFVCDQDYCSECGGLRRTIRVRPR